ncbi:MULTISPECIES: hypothetical protein [unclassified Streptomyces]|uniref:hypothetical protein n=1 Tax=unclassified Streptomyces TaxID=2593676 RepID=UPI002E14E257|nr:hypothetical protein OG533_32650 [Streptomyces sp. NBC_01186]WSS44936.1 hypothetical protein OG220_33325 [Streptomyces sp. NBC_01187]
MEITVQWVRTSWTKASRGGEMAARRNATPVGFAVPPLEPSTAHVVRMRERDGFVPRESQEDVRRVDVQLREAEGRLRIHPRVQPFLGLPPRRRRPPAVRLAPGQWARWQLNYRFSSMAGTQDWSYWLDTFNIAYGPVRAGAFLAEPDVYVDERGPLR